VLVERAQEPVKVERAALDDRPFVGEEGQPLAEDEQRRPGDEGGQREQPRRDGDVPAAPNAFRVDAPPGRRLRLDLRPG
jgi:hypothetical protein